MRVGSLFSGIGGLDLGLERAGMEIIWQVENDPYCRKVLKKHWSGVPCYGDIKEIDFATLPAVDLICGGFPCQPVSCAGQRKGDKDKRWLWPEFFRAICEARPRWVLVENVPGLLSADAGRLFGGILRDLAGSGYDAEWDCLSAEMFGAPHKRERVFIIAYPNGYRLEKSPHEGILRISPNNRISMRHARSMGGTEQWAKTRPIGARPMGVDNGIPTDVDRLKCLGNAVVPQVAEWIGRRIMETLTPRQKP